MVIRGSELSGVMSNDTAADSYFRFSLGYTIRNSTNSNLFSSLIEKPFQTPQFSKVESEDLNDRDESVHLSQITMGVKSSGYIKSNVDVVDPIPEDALEETSRKHSNSSGSVKKCPLTARSERNELIEDVVNPFSKPIN